MSRKVCCRVESSDVSPGGHGRACAGIDEHQVLEGFDSVVLGEFLGFFLLKGRYLRFLVDCRVLLIQTCDSSVFVDLSHFVVLFNRVAIPITVGPACTQAPIHKRQPNVTTLSA